MSRSNQKRQVHPMAHNGSRMHYRTFNNRVVEAKLEGSEVLMGFQNWLQDIFKDNDYIKPLFGKKTYLADCYYGRAYCNVDEGDIFDEDKGKQIAAQRCTSLYHSDFNAQIVNLLEELHRTEARIFNRLRKSGNLDLYFKARGVDEIFDDSFIMDGQKMFWDYLKEAGIINIEIPEPLSNVKTENKADTDVKMD